MMNKKTPIPKIKNARRALLGCLTVAAFFLILCSTDTAIEYMKKGLVLCAATVIPSLFPFMVISELIVSSGIGVRASRFFSKPMRWLFGVSESGAAAYLLGLVCGFPIGAKTAVSMYDRGCISKRELERTLAFCNNPGSAFVMSAVGVSLFSNKKLGVLLYACVIISSVIVGLMSKLTVRDKIREHAIKCSVKAEGEFGIASITSAVQSSAVSMMTVCAYVVFFSAFVGCMGALLAKVHISGELMACVFGFFELSSGVRAAAESNNALGAVFLCALFLGWSGLSVHFQIMSVCSNRGISFAPYIMAKSLQGVLCAAISWISLKFVCPDILSANSSVFLPENTMGITKYACLAFFISSALFAFFSSKKRT